MLEKRLVELAERRKLPWEVTGRRVVVSVTGDGRHQVVRFGVDGEMAWFESTVLRSSEVTLRVRRWRELARRAWRRNAVQGMVGFAFDAQDALVGRVEYPMAELDDEELVEIVGGVAAECDRFEMGVVGGDWE